MRLCYIEDQNGGFLCYSKDKEYFLKNYDKVVCCEGDKLEVEKYLNRNISNEMITIPILSTSDAFIMLEKGKKVRRKVWKQGDYIKLNKVGRIFDKNNRVCPITLSMLYNDWEIVE